MSESVQRRHQNRTWKKEFLQRTIIRFQNILQADQAQLQKMMHLASSARNHKLHRDITFLRREIGRDLRYIQRYTLKLELLEDYAFITSSE